MGRTKAKQTADSLRVFSNDERVQLLAWLDFCLEESIDFHDTAVDHLKHKTDKDFTRKQIHDKLRSEWRRDGRHKRGTNKSNSKTDELYSKGSASLVRLNHDIKRDVEKALCGLRASTARYPLRGRASASRGQSRARSIVPSSEGSNDSSYRAPSEDELLSSATEFGAIRVGSVLGDQQGTELSRPQKTVKNETECANSHDDFPPVNSSRRRTHKGGQDLQLLELKSQLGERESQLQDVEATIARQQNLILSLTNQLSAVKEEKKLLDDFGRSAKSHQDQSSTVMNLLRQTASLRKQITDSGTYRTGAQSIGEGRFGIKSQDIGHQFYLLERQVADGCSSLILKEPLPGLDDLRRAGHCDALDTLAQRITGSGYEQLRTHVLCNEVSEFDIFRSFVAAGLCSLVFDSSFPNFIATESPLLDQYRRHILARDGPRVLQQIDLQSNKSLMDTESFKSDLNDNKSRELSCRLVASLSAFLVAEPRASSQDLSHHHEMTIQASSWGNQVAPEAAFHETFILALSLKSRLVLCRKRFQLVYFVPGTAFDAATMVKNGASLADHGGRREHKRQRLDPEIDTSDDRHSVGLCIFPALYECPLPELSDEYPIGGDMESCVVDCQKFVTDGNLNGYVLAVKAVVLLRSD